MRTTKQQKENLKNYLFDACTDRAADYGREEPKTWEEAKAMIQEIFAEEKGWDYTKPLFARFNSWIFGLCFCSPIMEDLSQFTSQTDEMEAERETAWAIYDLIFKD